GGAFGGLPAAPAIAEAETASAATTPITRRAKRSFTSEPLSVCCTQTNCDRCGFSSRLFSIRIDGRSAIGRCQNETVKKDRSLLHNRPKKTGLIQTTRKDARDRDACGA